MTKPLPRADRLSEPPVVGQHYLVPAIRWRWGQGAATSISDMWWPVIGPKHNDEAFFNFHNQHYHLDPRFLSRTHWKQIGPDARGKMMGAISRPLNSTQMPDGPPAPMLHKMRCTLDAVPYPEYAAGSQQVCAFNEHFAGTQCAKGKRGWVCPHRLVPLGSIKPVDGVITCFLHGLRLDAETGVCLGPEKSA